MYDDMIKEGERLSRLASDLAECFKEMHRLNKENNEFLSSIDMIEAQGPYQGPYAEIRREELKGELQKETGSDFIASIEGGKKIASLLKSLQCVDIANHLDSFLDKWENTQNDNPKEPNSEIKPLGCVLTGLLALVSTQAIPLIVGMFDEDFEFNHFALLMIGSPILVIAIYFVARKLTNNRRQKKYEEKVKKYEEMCAAWENSYKQFISSNLPYFNSIPIDEAQVKKETAELAEYAEKLNSQIDISFATEETLVSEIEEMFPDIFPDIGIYDEKYGKVVWSVRDLFSISALAKTGIFYSWEGVIAEYQKTEGYGLWRRWQGAADSIWDL